MEKQKTTVRVAGKDYNLVSSETPEYMTRVAAYVDKKLDDMRIATQLPLNMTAVLTSLNLADELMKSQDENRLLRFQLEELIAENTRLKELAKK